MKWLIAALLTLTTSTPLQFTVQATQHMLVASIIYERDVRNADITVAVTALDGTPNEWASDTVLHVLLLEDQENGGREAFDDLWPGMHPGHYRMVVTLHREKEELKAPPIDVEVR